MSLTSVLIYPFLLALLVFGARRWLSAAVQGWLLALSLAVAFALGLAHIPLLEERGSIIQSFAWVEQIGLTLTFYIDGLSLLFILLVTGMGTAIMLYAGYYFDDRDESGCFLALMMAFTGAMLALVTAGNVLTLFIAWELTSIISFLLIGFKGKDPNARHGALQALMITGGGGLALLVGLLLLGGAAGGYDMAQLLTSGDVLRAHPWYTAIAVLLMIGAFSKSAQFPLHFWLPQAMTAPTPASAFLHSATMVKAGIYLLARFAPVLGNTDFWTVALVGVGLVTLLLGALLALRQRDLKGALAFSTISQLGALVALIGLPDSIGIKAAMVGILAHALYKGALFLVVGAVDHATGTRDIDQLGGLRRQMPGFAVVAAIAALSMAGVPPLFGFVSKELLIDAALHVPFMFIAVGVVFVSAALTVAMALILFWDVFMGERKGQHGHEEAPLHEGEGLGVRASAPHFHTPPAPLVWGPMAIAALSLVLGIGIAPLITPIVQLAVGKPTSLYLFPPEGINQAFILSALALAAGGLVFVLRSVWLAWRIPTILTGPQVYAAAVRGVEGAAAFILKSQNGRIRDYLLVILVAVIALMTTSGVARWVDWDNVVVQLTSVSDVLKVVLLVVALGATFAAIMFRQHLLAALALGVSGYSIGGIFLLEPAPDVALVQFLVETIATVLIIMILVRTSTPEREQVIEREAYVNRWVLLRDISLSALVGIGVTLFALAAVSSRPTPQSISQWHLENALPQTQVNDVVASIVTDFRGMDTLIEITVFGMAALGVLTLLAPTTPGRTMALRLLRKKDSPSATADVAKAEGASPAPEPPVPVYTFAFSDALNRFAARIVLPFGLLVALAHILYAGSAPGDGFTAGVIAGLAIALWYIIFGYEAVKTQLRWLHPPVYIGVGLVLALGNALLPLLFGREFFAFTFLASLPADIKLASTTVFEVGIFLSVFGGISAIMEAITHPQEVEKL
ncbi:MAG: hydrogen gas-evolving membrane-bound hydrogenase subunit E [Chloroflexota bacterium]|nr:hydrogen gas-evolving membrane-bound hydrogenase subunit E [Chloroflexota bacterium]